MTERQRRALVDLVRAGEALHREIHHALTKGEGMIEHDSDGTGGYPAGSVDASTRWVYALDECRLLGVVP